MLDKIQNKFVFIKKRILMLLPLLVYLYPFLFYILKTCLLYDGNIYDESVIMLLNPIVAILKMILACIIFIYLEKNVLKFWENDDECCFRGKYKKCYTISKLSYALLTLTCLIELILSIIIAIGYDLELINAFFVLVRVIEYIFDMIAISNLFLIYSYNVFSFLNFSPLWVYSNIYIFVCGLLVLLLKTARETDIYLLNELVAMELIWQFMLGLFPIAVVIVLVCRIKYAIQVQTMMEYHERKSEN